MNLNEESNFYQKFTKVETLGSGAYGDVFKVVCNKSGDFKALKKIKPKERNNSEIDPIILREIVILNDLRNHNVVKLLDVFKENTNILLVFEFMKGNLYKLIEQICFDTSINNNFRFLSKCNHIFDHKVLKNTYNFTLQCIFKQLIDGLKYIHHKKVIHRDLKPANILINYEGDNLEETLLNEVNKALNLRDDSSENSQNKLDFLSTYDELKIGSLYRANKSKSSCSFAEKIKIKIADFGLARLSNSDKNIPYTKNLVTLCYRSPELLLNASDYNECVDIWSLGCIFAELIIGFPLFPGENEIDQLNKIFKIIGTPSCFAKTMKFKLNSYLKVNFKEYIKEFNPLVDESAIELVEYMLNPNYKERINIREVSKCQFMKIEFI